MKKASATKKAALSRQPSKTAMKRKIKSSPAPKKMKSAKGSPSNKTKKVKTKTPAYALPPTLASATLKLKGIYFDREVYAALSKIKRGGGNSVSTFVNRLVRQGLGLPKK